jgi:hypothetical protein
LGPPLAGQACRCGGRLGRGERHRDWLWGYCRTGRIVHWRGRGDVWGINTRQQGSVGGEHLGQHVRQMVQQMESIRHLAGCGCPKACRFRIGLRPIPYEPLAPGMGLQPLRHGRGFPVGEQGQGPPPGEIQQEGPVGMALAQGTIVHAEDLWGDHHGAGGAADHPQQGVPTDGEAERLAQPHPRARVPWRGGVPPIAASAAPRAPQGRAVAR